METPTRIVFACCFCGRDIHEEDDGGKGLALVNGETGDFEQQWWCHVDCLLNLMTATAASAYYAGQ